MSRLLILADDLSGAADCGAACRRQGLDTVVCLDEAGVDTLADVCVLDADTRRLSAAAAAARMEALVHKHAADRDVLLFKKIDSTLRGHLGAELAAVLRARRTHVPGSFAVLAPAFPSAGRTTVDGLHYLHGRPLHATEIWHHQKMRGDARISAMLEADAVTTAHLPLAVVRGSEQEMRDAVSRGGRSADVVVCDAASDADLAAIAAATAAFGTTAVWVGSAGLAQHLPGAVGLALPDAAEMQAVEPVRGPILFVIGSLSQLSRQQVERLAAAAELAVLVIPPNALIEGTASSAWEGLTAQVCRAIDAGQDVLLTVGPDPEVDLPQRAQLVHGLAVLAAPWRSRIGALVVSGGETARAVLERWSITALHLRGEVEPGIPVSVAEGSGSPRLPVITKAGAFGAVDTLLHCRAFLRGRGGKTA